MATPGLRIIKVFWKKGYNIIIFVYDVTNKFLSRDSNYIVDVVKWPKFSISMRKVIITSILQGFDKKNRFFVGWSWFKFNNLGLALVTNLKFYTSLAKGLKQSQKVFWANSYVCRSYSGKTGRGAFLPPFPPPPTPLILNRDEITVTEFFSRKSWLLDLISWSLTESTHHVTIEESFINEIYDLRN